MVHAVRSKALNVSCHFKINLRRTKVVMKKGRLHTPLEFVYALLDDSIAPSCRSDTLQPVDNELTSLDESCTACLAGFHFGMSLMHKLHCGVGCTQSYTTHE